MPTKAQVIKAARLKVRKACDKVYRLADELKQAEKDLKAAHKDFGIKTGIHYIDFVSKQSEKAFRRRVGKKEAERLDRLAACNELAFKYEKEGLTRIQSCKKAWKELGWNADCSKRLK